MTKIALWICVCTDDWAVESEIKASNAAVCWPTVSRHDRTSEICNKFPSSLMSETILTYNTQYILNNNPLRHFSYHFYTTKLLSISMFHKRNQ